MKIPQPPLWAQRLLVLMILFLIFLMTVSAQDRWAKPRNPGVPTPPPPPSRHNPNEPAPLPTLLPVCLPTQGDTTMCLVSYGPKPLQGRIPVVFIHGWNRNGVPAPPEPEDMLNLIRYLHPITWVSEKFKFYELNYFSNAASIRTLGTTMARLVAAMGVQDPDFLRQKLVIVGYSMGGLIGRSFMEENILAGVPAGTRVLRLVTLATPHHGTPVTNGPARDAKAGPLVGPLIDLFDNGLFNVNLTWSIEDRYGLHWDNYDGMLDYQRFPSDANLWLDHLNRYGKFQNKISAYGGVVQPVEDINRCVALDFGCLAAVLRAALAIKQSDGVVPLASASFANCNGCISHDPLVGYDHLQMASGLSANDSNLFGLVAGDLSDLVSSNDARFDSAVFFGDENDEPFHNLRNWGELQNPNFGQGRDRAVSTSGRSSVDLFVTPPQHLGQDFVANDVAPAGEYDLLVEYDQQTCRSQFTAYANGDMVGTFSHGVGSDDGVVPFVIPAKDITGRRVTVSFQSDFSSCLPLIKAVEISVRGNP